MITVECTLEDIARAWNMTPTQLMDELDEDGINRMAFVGLTNQRLEEELSAQVLDGYDEHTTSLSEVASEALDTLRRRNVA